MATFWIDDEKFEWGGHVDVIPPKVRRAIADPSVIQVFGPYDDDAAPASVAECTADKRLKG